MTDFQCNELRNNNTVMLQYLRREQLYLKPSYQRESEVWSLRKKQLLIDSLINGFDIPKLYYHEFEKPERHDGKLCKYSIIDGKQRLSAIWDFMDGAFALSDESVYLRNPKLIIEGLTYSELAKKYPDIQAMFTGRPLSIVTIRTGDVDLIEDMFSRLNEAVPLNAAEKRNALGGPVPPVIRKLVGTKFFKNTISVSSRRYRHHDLACKFLFIEQKEGPTETKKIRLDTFVEDFKGGPSAALRLKQSVLAVLEHMNLVYRAQDPLLKSPGTIVVYYLLFRGWDPKTAKKDLRRAAFLKFEEKLINNRTVAEMDEEKADFKLLEYDRLNQTPNDESAIKYRLAVLTEYLKTASK